MSTLIFDIETIGQEWDSKDSATQSVLSRWIDKTAQSESEHFALYNSHDVIATTTLYKKWLEFRV
ncbi:MAG: hypothetical protein ACI92I_000421 [Acidimicrobiales bacterium]|jgi:hypothetical protein